MEVTPFVLTKNTRMKLSSVRFSPGPDNASVAQHPLVSLRERFNLCFFHLPGRSTVNLLCALLIERKETPSSH